MEVIQKSTRNSRFRFRCPVCKKGSICTIYVYGKIYGYEKWS